MEQIELYPADVAERAVGKQALLAQALLEEAQESIKTINTAYEEVERLKLLAAPGSMRNDFDELLKLLGNRSESSMIKDPSL